MLPLADTETHPGIVFAFRFDSDGRGMPIGRNDPLDLAGGGAAFWWIHVNLVDKRGCDWISSLAILPDEAKDVLLSADIHDRVDIEGDVLAGVFVDLRLDFANATEDMAHLRFALAGRVLVTGRRQALRSVEATRAAVLTGQRVESALDLLEAIVDREADVIAMAATELGHAVDAIEDKILEGQTNEVGADIGSLRRKAVKLNRQLARLLGLFRRVELAPGIRLPADIREAAGRMAQRLESIHQEIHSSQERARLLQDEVAARMAADTNRQLYVLSMLTAVFLPATLVTGLFGMNTEGLPFVGNSWGFWLASLVALAAAGSVYLLIVLMIRRRSGQS